MKDSFHSSRISCVLQRTGKLAIFTSILPVRFFSCRSLKKSLNALQTTLGTAQSLTGRASSVISAATCARNVSVGRTRSSVPTPPAAMEGSASPVTATSSSRVMSASAGMTHGENAAKSELTWPVWRHLESGMTSWRGCTLAYRCKRTWWTWCCTLVWCQLHPTCPTCRWNVIIWLSAWTV